VPIGVPELIIVLVIVLLVFGPKRLPQLGRQLGGGMREFRDGIQGKKDDDDADSEEDDAAAARPEITRAAQADVLDPTPDATKTPTGGRDESATRSGG
jgi:sec-independent protein translocase protein TatA